MKILLLQVRAPDDAMAQHERLCVARRLAIEPDELHIANAVAAPARADWLDGVDAMIIGGSGAYSVHHTESEPWVDPLRKLLDSALQRDLPSFAICFGHQLLGLHFGAPVITDPDREEIGTVQLRLTWEGRQCPLFSQLGGVFDAQTGHSDHVVGLPPGVELLATGLGCTTQAFKVIDKRFYSSQFHPDLTGEEAKARYLSNKRDQSGRVAANVARNANAFRSGRDEATRLLPLFIETVVKPGL